MTLIIICLQVIHYELPNDSETFVHRSGRTGRAGKLGSAVLMFTNNQRRTVKTLERDVGCRFEFVTPPTIEEVLESSAAHVVATLNGVHPESIQFFTPTAQKLIEEQGTTALAAALAQLSGFSRPPSSRSLISHEQVIIEANKYLIFVKAVYFLTYVMEHSHVVCSTFDILTSCMFIFHIKRTFTQISV